MLSTYIGNRLSFARINDKPVLCFLKCILTYGMRGKNYTVIIIHFSDRSLYAVYTCWDFKFVIYTERRGSAKSSFSQKENVTCCDKLSFQRTRYSSPLTLKSHVDFVPPSCCCFTFYKVKVANKSFIIFEYMLLHIN